MYIKLTGILLEIELIDTISDERLTEEIIPMFDSFWIETVLIDICSGTGMNE